MGKRRNLKFPDPLTERAEKIAEEMDIHFAEVVRQALMKFVEQYEQQKERLG